MHINRASFWIGDPRYPGRRLLGCVSDMGSPHDVDILLLRHVRSEYEMERTINAIVDFRRTADMPRSIVIPDNLVQVFAAAKGLFGSSGVSLPRLERGWIFRTPSIFDIEYTYAWFSNRLNVAMKNSPFRSFDQIRQIDAERDAVKRKAIADRTFGPVRLDAVLPPH